MTDQLLRDLFSVGGRVDGPVELLLQPLETIFLLSEERVVVAELPAGLLHRLVPIDDRDANLLPPIPKLGPTLQQPIRNRRRVEGRRDFVDQLFLSLDLVLAVEQLVLELRQLHVLAQRRRLVLHVVDERLDLIQAENEQEQSLIYIAPKVDTKWLTFYRSS